MNAESQKTLKPTPDSRPLPFKDVPIHAGTPWPKPGKMLGSLFKTGKDWQIPPNYTNDSNISTDNTTGLKPPIKVEPKPEIQPTTSPKAEKFGWGPNCPFCKNLEEDWNGDHQSQLQQQPQPQVQMITMQHPQTLNYQKPKSFQRSNSKTFDVSDWYPSQSKLSKQWGKEKGGSIANTI